MIEAYEDYIKKVIDRFNVAVKFLWVDQLTGQKLLEIETAIVEKPSVPHGFWDQWPESPTSIPLYMRAGHSALHIAAIWPDAIYGAIAYGRLETVQRGSRDCKELTADQSKAWVEASIKQARGHTDIDCNGVARFREIDLLRRKIDAEIAQWSSPQRNKHEQTDWSSIIEWCGIGHKRGGPTVRQKKILLSLVENGGHRSFGDLSAECEFDWENPEESAVLAAKRINTCKSKPSGWQLKREDLGLRIIFPEK